MADGKKAFSWDDFDKQQSSGGKKPFLWDDEADQNPNLPGGTPALAAAVRAGNTPGAQTQPTQFEQERTRSELLLDSVRA
jgi:hypothetical protein